MGSLVSGGRNPPNGGLYGNVAPPPYGRAGLGLPCVSSCWPWPPPAASGATTPSWRTCGKRVVPERVVSLHGDNGLFILETDAGTRVRALSVIVATGMRALANERHFLGRGLFVTYMGYEYFPKLIDRVAEAGRDGVVVFGNHKSAHLADLMRRANLNACHLSGGLRQARRLADKPS